VVERNFHDAQRKADILINGLKDTFAVCNLVYALQYIVFIEGEIMATPNFSDKSTTTKSPKLLAQVRDMLRENIAVSHRAGLYRLD
jgi:hypothetical protein